MRRFKGCKVGSYLKVSEVMLINKQMYNHEDLQTQKLKAILPPLWSPLRFKKSI
jgi:hypothetical protein